MNTTINKLDLGTNSIGYAIVNENKYTKYKDSGIDWLGKIPRHWECKRLGNWFVDRRQKVSDKDFEPLSVTKNGIVPQLESAAKSNDGDNRKLVRKGDFVINSRSDRKGSSGLSPLDGSVSLINIVMKPRNVNGGFINHLLKSNGFIEEFYRNGHGIVADLWTTRFDEMKFIHLAIPPISEQKAIAAFLDEKCGKIDELVSVKEQQITLLKERRQVVIHEAVTKGIKPDIEMRDSGINWIGEIPSHWEVKRLKFTSKLINDKSISKHSELPYYGMENIESWSGNYIKTDSEVDGLGNIFYEGNVLFGKLRPYLAKVHLAVESGICSSEFLVYDSKLLNNKYLKTMMISPEFIKLVNASTYGAKMPRANSEFINNQEVPIPPITEQEAIVTYLEEQTGKVDQAIAIKTEQITKLKEYKQSLINEVVTGKVKVC